MVFLGFIWPGLVKSISGGRYVQGNLVREISRGSHGARTNRASPWKY